MTNPSARVSITPLQRRLSWKRALSTLSADAPKTVVLATFTAQPFEALLGSSLFDQGIESRVVTGPYDQILPECIQEGSETDLVQPGIVVVWPRVEDVWRGSPSPLNDDLRTYVDPMLELVEAAIAACRRWSATLVFVLPVQPEVRPLGVGDAVNPQGVLAAWELLRTSARQALSEVPGVLVVDAEQTVRRLGIGASSDPRLMTIARVPYTDVAFCGVADDIARVVSLARRGARKIAIVDADNTLWGGVVGEDGATGIDLLDNGPGEAFRSFQGWLLELRRSGTIIALASKNNEPEVWEAFERREMVLEQSHLAAWRVNWDPKSANIEAMIEELNLGLASAVFIDDNPIELAEVGEVLPEVALLQMPSDPALWVREIADSGLLDRLPPTREDLARADSYSAESLRRIVREKLSPEQYLASLQISVVITDPSPADLARLAQLVAKTNQFTLGGHRHDEPALAAMVTSLSARIRLVSVVDRFGDYGVVGATISLQVSDRGHVLDTFVLSCRAMGRGVEEAMLADCLSAGGSIAVTVFETSRNLPGRTFFARYGATPGVSTNIVDVAWPSHVERKSV
jgi:FkbH-like protein